MKCIHWAEEPRCSYVLLLAAYVARREGTVFTGVCLSKNGEGGTSWALIPGPFMREVPLASGPRSFCGIGVLQSGHRTRISPQPGTGQGTPSPSARTRRGRTPFWAVCLLWSRRRTSLLLFHFDMLLLKVNIPSSLQPSFMVSICNVSL